MPSYLGTPGNLIAFKCSAEEISKADNISLEWTLGGVQKAQYGARTPRAWKLSMSIASSEQLAGLAGLVVGLYGPPPWVYVGAWAQVTNLLTPPASVLAPGSWSGSGIAGGPVDLAGAPRPVLSVLNASGGSINLPAVPVAVGVPVTGSAWAAGSASYQVQLVFRNAAGGTVSTASATVVAGVGAPLVRGSVTAVPPSSAVDVQLRLVGALRAAQPAVTWTPDMAPWIVGEGATKVIARGLSVAVKLAASRQRSLAQAGVSFTLEEVGNA